MDLLLTHGYCLAEDPAEQQIMRPYPPLGLLYLSAHLKARGFSVEVFDPTFSSIEAFEALVRSKRPPVVGLYCNLMTRQNILRMIAAAAQSGAHLVVGGPEPVNYAEEFLVAGAHVVVAGEGELTLEALIPHLAARGLSEVGTIAGIAYLEEGRVVFSPPRDKIRDLDAQPFPDRSAIDLGRYLEAWRRHHGYGAVSLITSRGCPFRCDWCSHAVFGHTHRRRSPKNVADEVALIVETYRPESLWYADDVFTIHRKWFFEYAAELERRGLNLPFETISREDRLDEEVIATLARMGCRRMWIGAESGSQRILDAMQRQTSAERVREMIRLLQRHGIAAGTFIMLGYVGEEVADIEATVEHLKAALPDEILTTVAYPIKGTGFYQKVEERVRPLKIWREGSDRDHTIVGRKSRRFYEFAREWMVHEVELHRLRQQGSKDRLGMMKHLLRAKRGRLGMLATTHEVETAEQP